MHSDFSSNSSSNTDYMVQAPVCFKHKPGHYYMNKKTLAHRVLQRSNRANHTFCYTVICTASSTVTGTGTVAATWFSLYPPLALILPRLLFKEKYERISTLLFSHSAYWLPTGGSMILITKTSDHTRPRGPWVPYSYLSLGYLVLPPCFLAIL